MASLYNLTHDYQTVLDMIYDEAHDEQAVIDTLDSIEGAIEDKAEGYCKIIKQLEADAQAIKEEEMRLRERRIVYENRKERLKQNLFDTMKATGIPKIKTTLFNVGIQKNGGKRRLVLDIEAGMLPAYYREVEYKVNNDRLRESLGDAEKNEWCHLEEQTESLRIR